MSKAKLRVLALLLVACMVFAMAPAARAASSVEFTQVDASQLGNVARNELTQTEQAADIPADEAVRVIIILEEKSAVDQGYSTLGLAENPAAFTTWTGCWRIRKTPWQRLKLPWAKNWT